MINRNLAALVLFIATILMLFQNCGRNFEASGSATSFSFCKLQANTPSTFVSSKVRIKQQFFSAQQKLNPTKTNNLKLSLVVDVACYNSLESPLFFMGEKILLKKRQLSTLKAATTIKIKGQPSISDLEDEMDTSPCLLGLAENPDVKRTQSFTSSAVNDPQSSQQRHLGFLGHDRSLELQSNITSKVVIAFVDSGVDYNHPDLSQRMWQDSNGNFGYNFVKNNNTPLDDDGHGTHVAGIVAAIENNSYGVAGLTGDYVEIMAVKVLDNNGAGSSQAVYNGIQYAIKNGADIINLSVESSGQNSLMEDALTDAVNAGIIVTAATGNQSDKITSSNLYAPSYIGPGLGGVISVASVDTSNTQLSNFSNYSSTYAELSAPGAEDSSYNNGGILSTSLNGQWTRIRGTSQATPMVTAAAAILIGYLKTKNVNYTPNAIETFLKTNGSMVSSSLTPYVSGGQIIHLGFLTQNLIEYFSDSTTSTDPNFNGDTSTGNTCVIN